MTCEGCIRQKDCTFVGTVGGIGCRDWEGIPAEDANRKLAQERRDEFWGELRDRIAQGKITDEEMTAQITERKRMIAKSIDEKRDQQAEREAEIAQRLRELEVWRQAYNAALSCSNVCNTEACDCANSALIDYRAKREEMGR